MAIPFDFGALAQGIGQTGSLIQQYLMDKYMRGQEMQTWTQQQNILDQFQRQAEERAEKRTISSEERAFEQNKKLLDYQRETEANFRLFDMTPDYQALVQRASSPEGNLNDQMQLIGIQQIKARQMKLEPLNENDYTVIGRLPVTMQNMFNIQERQNEEVRRQLELQEQHYETMEEYYKSMIPGREATAELTRTRTDKLKEEFGEDFKKRYDDLNTDLQQLRKEHRALMNDEDYKMLRTINANESHKKQYWDDIREADLQSFRVMEEGITSRIKEIEQELKNMRQQKKNRTLNLNLKTLPDDVHTVPPIPLRVLTAVQTKFPQLSYEEIERMWAKAGGRLSPQDMKALGLTEKDLRE